MALLSGSALDAELQRKKSLGIQPTSSANKALYDSLSVTPKPDGGMSIRKYFNDNGYNDVNYDKGTNTVRVNGMDAITPSRINGGVSYASGDDLAKSLTQLQNKDTTNRVNTILGQLEKASSTPYQAPEFKYDAASDPVYQSLLANYKTEANKASGDTAAYLNKRGILNSSITSNDIAQIQQQAIDKANNDMITSLLPQAYNRYRDTVGDQYQANRNQINDLATLLGLTSDTNQQRLDNQYRNDQANYQQSVDNRNYNRGVLESDRNYNRGILESDRNYNRGVLESDRNYGLDQSQLALSRSNSAIDNALAREKFDYQKEQDKKNYGSSSNSSDVYKALNNAADVIDKSAVYTTDPTDISGKRQILANKDAVESQILNSGLPEYQMWQLYQRYGIPWEGNIPSPQ